MNAELKPPRSGRGIRHVLFISHIFPPTTSGGAQRIKKIFEAVEGSCQLSVDVLTSADIGPEIPPNVHAVRDPLRDLKNGVLYLCRGLSGFFKRAPSHASDSCLETRTLSRDSVLKRLFFVVFMIPDEHIGFVIVGFIRGITMWWRRPYDVILSTYPPASNTVLGLLLSKVLGIPHIVDMREPWLDTPDWSLRFSGGTFQRLRLSLERRIERMIMVRAQAVIVNHKWMRSSYEGLISRDARLYVIPNGYDSDVVAKVNVPHASASQVENCLHVVYAGSCYMRYQPDLLLEALSLVIRQYPEFSSRLRITIMGTGDCTTSSIVRDYSSRLNVRWLPPRSQGEVFKLLRGATVAAVFLPPIRWSSSRIPGKIYELVALQVPTVTFGLAGSALEALCSELRLPFRDANDISAIADLFVGVFTGALPRGALVGDLAAVRQYEYKIIQQQICDVLL